jgi:hypothetical protein
MRYTGGKLDAYVVANTPAQGDGLM